MFLKFHTYTYNNIFYENILSVNKNSYCMRYEQGIITRYDKFLILVKSFIQPQYYKSQIL